MKLSDLVQPSRVLCNVEARSKKHAFEIISELMSSGDVILDKNEVFSSLFSRERLGSTGLGAGVALPHGRFADIEETLGAFIKLSEPIDFDAFDGQAVDLIFGLLVPMECSKEHFAAVGRVASIFSEADFKQQIHEANSSSSLYELIVTSDVIGPEPHEQ